MTTEELADKLIEIYENEENPTGDYVSWLVVAKYVQRLLYEARLEELKQAQGKIALSGYHGGYKPDLDWINHRIAELEGEIELHKNKLKGDSNDKNKNNQE